MFLIADSKTVLIWSFKQAIPNIDPRGKGKGACHSWPEPRPISNTQL